MHWTTVYYVVVGLANLTAVMAFYRSWASKHSERQQTHAEQVQAVQANTTATIELTKRLDLASNTLNNHEKRLWQLEWIMKHRRPA